jgi:hypothetical protein
MRFQAEFTFRVEAASLAEAEQAIDLAGEAAYRALDRTQVRDDPDGLYSGSITPLDDEATAALTEDDHGPGRFFKVSTYGRE